MYRNEIAALEYSRLYDTATALADKHEQSFAICLIACEDTTELQIHPFIDLPTSVLDDELITIVTVIEPTE
tara:strand:+ start:27 stop:239 length:213 start_codon:yes stop_codon:yes gene_type:complete